MKTGIAKINETEIYYEISGAGKPLVLVNGSSLDLQMWDAQINDFNEHFQVVRYDLRGIGKSAIPEKNFSHSKDIYHLLNFLDIEKAHVLGLSVGGAFAVDFAAEHPEMVDSLILAAAATSDLRDEFSEGLSALSAMAKEKGVSAPIETLLQIPTFIAPENVEAIQKTREILFRNAHIFEDDFPLIRFWQPPQIAINDMLSKITAPTLIIVGSKDDSAIHEIAEMLEKNINHSKRLFIEDAGHLVNMEKPREFNQSVINFLQELKTYRVNY